MRRSFAIAAASVSLFLIAAPGVVRADEYRVTRPATHDNLAVYFVHAPSVSAPVPLSLEEAMAKGVVKVHETGRVTELAVENLGGEEVFIQSGDVVKGGQQDRVLMVSLLLPPRSGRTPIASFCVEQGRWTARGREDSRTFSASNSMVPSKEARLALRQSMVAATAGASDPTRPPQMNGGADAQTKIWSSVSTTQHKLSRILAASVAAPASGSSLQLSLENEKLKDAQTAYLRALQAAGEQGADIVGYVFAINGKIAGGDLYPSNALFRKMWPKLLTANATEALAEKDSPREPAPAAETVQAFLNVDVAKTSERALNREVRLATLETDHLIYAEMRRKDGTWLHRSYTTK
jgi:hypothetical protein